MCPVLAFCSRVQLEHLPLILAIAVGLAGSALVVDAFLVDQKHAPPTERRRRARAERHRVGEAPVGLGMLAAGAGLAGRDSWAYGTLMMMGGVIMLVLGAGLNYRLLGESMFHHGAARRQTATDPVRPGLVASTVPGEKGDGSASSDAGTADDRPSSAAAEAGARAQEASTRRR